MKQLLSDYDRKDLTKDEQIVMATLRALGARGTEDMKVTAKQIVAALNTENEFRDIVATYDKE